MYNIYTEKMVSGLVAGAMGVLCKSLFPLFICVVIFEIVDFYANAGTGTLKGVNI